jgi:lipoprotein-releasing system ATP-binding protein
MNKPVLDLQDVRRVFTQGDKALEVLKGISLQVHAGEMVALVGSSGAGKSTLLHLAGLLELPTSGQVTILGQDMSRAPDDKRTEMRCKALGFVYQFHHLMPEFTALENVMIPLMLQKTPDKVAKERAIDLLNRVGLQNRTTHRPAQLSGGEQQRVALARALANNPAILLADEPTGNLDEQTSQEVFEELIAFVRDKNLGALIATHDLQLASRMDRILRLHNGVIVS